MRKLPLIVFFLLLLMTISNCIVSYHRTKRCLESELDQALALTIMDKGYERMKQDSIKAYQLLASPSVESKVLTIGDPTFQHHIKTEALRPKAFIAYHITPTDEDFDVKMEGQAAYSMAFVWSVSNQRLSFWLSLAAFFFLLLSIRRREPAVMTSPVLPAHLTPMQEQLMDMFMQAPDHRLTKQEICDALWPKKDNAAETLYTTIRRLRNELQGSSGWEIESERGRSYVLKRRHNS